MIKIPYEQIVEKITTESSLSEAELTEKIDAKMKQLSGLISKEGAAHIVANELGIRLIEMTQGVLQIKNIVSGLRNVETAGKVVQTYPLKEFTSNGREGKVASVVLGDETGTIRLVMWGDQAENVNKMSTGTIVKVAGGYVRDNNNQLEVHANEKTQLQLDPKDVTIGEVKGGVQQSGTTRKSITELTENDTGVEILGTIVQVFEPRFYSMHPEKRKKLTEKDGAYYLDDKVVENPDHQYVMNVIVDDGNDTIRAVFFSQAMEQLLKKDKATILGYKETPGSFDSAKTELLGTIVKLKGKAKHNVFFDRLEFVAFEAEPNPDPQEEIKRLQVEKN